MNINEAIEQLKYYQNKPYVPTVRKVCDIALETIETQRQEIEKLKATLADWKYEVKCHMDEVVARNEEIEKLRNVIEEIKDNLHAINCVREMPDKVEMYANEAISIIDEIGGNVDV